MYSDDGTHTEFAKMYPAMFMETLRIQGVIILSLLSVHCIVHKPKDISAHHVNASRDGAVIGSECLAVP